MGILSRVEAFLERFLEAPAGRLGASIQPVSLAKRIERAMDTNKTYRDAGVIVPNQYDLHLNPGDYAAFASYHGSLEDDLAHGVLARARHERYTLVARPRVRILSDEETRRGEIRVAVRLVRVHGALDPLGQAHGLDRSAQSAGRGLEESLEEGLDPRQDPHRGRS